MFEIDKQFERIKSYKSLDLKISWPLIINSLPALKLKYAH